MAFRVKKNYEISGFTIIEALMTALISSLVVAGFLSFYLNFSAQSHWLSGHQATQQQGYFILERLQRSIYARGDGGFSPDCDEMEDDSSYCFTDCEADRTNCRTLGVLNTRSGSFGDYIITYYQTNCQQAAPIAELGSTPSFCGASCSLGYRPVVTITRQEFRSDILYSQNAYQFPPDTIESDTDVKRDRTLGAAMCFSSYSNDNSIGVEILLLAVSNNRRIHSERLETAFSAIGFDAMGVRVEQ